MRGRRPRWRRSSGASLPLRAQERLGEIGKAGGGFFTSDLSVGEFALADSIGCGRCAQVMGSSIYHVGWQQRPGSSALQMGGISQELRSCPRPGTPRACARSAGSSRRRSCVGATRSSACRFDRRPPRLGRRRDRVRRRRHRRAQRERRARGAAALTDLSGQDYWKLWQRGTGRSASSGPPRVYYIVPGFATQRAQRAGSASWANQELTDFTRASTTRARWRSAG